MAKNRRPGRRRGITALILVGLGLLLTVAAVGWAAHKAPRAFTMRTVTSAHMLPTYPVGEQVFFERTPSTGPARGDVVLVTVPWIHDNAAMYRVVAVGGDHLSFTPGSTRLVLNDRPLEEPYLLAPSVPAVVPFDLTVPQGRVFLMGDNRVNSLDSSFNLAGEGRGTVVVKAVHVRAVENPVGYMIAGSLGGSGMIVLLPAGILIGISSLWARRRARKATAETGPPPRVVGANTVG